MQPKPSFPPGRVSSTPRWVRPATIALGVWAIASCAFLFFEAIDAMLELGSLRAEARARELAEQPARVRLEPPASDVATSGDVWLVDAGVEGRAAPAPIRAPAAP